MMECSISSIGEEAHESERNVVMLDDTYIYRDHINDAAIEIQLYIRTVKVFFFIALKRL